MARTVRPTTATHTAARLASSRSTGLVMLVGLARSSNLGSSSSSVSAIVPSGLARSAAQLGTQSGPSAVGAQCLEPAYRVPAGGAVEREGDDLGPPADARDRHRAAEAVAERLGRKAAVGRVVAVVAHQEHVAFGYDDLGVIVLLGLGVVDD